uniref:RNA-directed DNA polymerase, eukaryota n=1 Tax=Tanacetum cinerariifolium TaxID=118510 RepID=A0A6L2K7V6_TANCI|nr:RNA-directed DNA polymerase, eukaryota [Tanacetum cinerariifolium]
MKGRRRMTDFDRVMKSKAISFFFTNFPDNWDTKALWRMFEKYGDLEDFERRLKGILIGDTRIVINRAKFIKLGDKDVPISHFPPINSASPYKFVPPKTFGNSFKEAVVGLQPKTISIEEDMDIRSKLDFYDDEFEEEFVGPSMEDLGSEEFFGERILNNVKDKIPDIKNVDSYVNGPRNHTPLKGLDRPNLDNIEDEPISNPLPEPNNSPALSKDEDVVDQELNDLLSSFQRLSNGASNRKTMAGEKIRKPSMRCLMTILLVLCRLNTTSIMLIVVLWEPQVVFFQFGITVSFLLSKRSSIEIMSLLSGRGLEVYAPQDNILKTFLWAEIESLVNMINAIWIIFGDFNVVRSADEMAGTMFNSDHCPILLKVSLPDFRPKPFKVFDKWVGNVDFGILIKRSWFMDLPSFTPNLILKNKIKRLRSDIKVWSAAQLAAQRLAKEDLIRNLIGWDLKAKSGLITFDDVDKREEWIIELNGIERLFKEDLKQKEAVTHPLSFFREWSRGNAKTLLHILHYFELASGLKVNIGKSIIFGIGIPNADVSLVASSLGCVHDVLPFTYLGLLVGKKMREGVQLMDSFPRLYALDSFQVCSIRDRWHLVNGYWTGNWNWRVQPRGKALGDLDSLISMVGSLSLSSEGYDKWN